MTTLENGFDILKSQLKPRIRDLLISEGVQISSNGMFRCVNPQHNDSNASMKLLADLNEEQVWCYGCNSTGDIFTVNHWLTKAPLSGIEFIQDNALKLADKFGVQHDGFSITPEQAEKLEWYRLYNIVSEKLVFKDERGEPINWTTKHCETRGWNPRTCEKLRVSTIKDYNALLRDIQKETGLTIEALQSKGITSELFGPDLITISLFDERGRVVGFTARNLKWSKESKTQKYKNSAHSPIFQKGNTLYGMHLMRASKHRRLDIFEGNGSMITAYGAGHNSCVALCGSTITEAQIKLIIDIGFTHINLVLDNDQTGKNKTDDLMQKLSGIEGLRVECTRLAFKNEDQDLKDPEDFISKYGLQEFFKLKAISAFDWYLEKEKENCKTSPVEFCNKMVRVIFNTANRIERSRQRAKLSELTGIPEADIEAEINRIEKTSVVDIKNTLSRKIMNAKSADDIASAIEETKNALDQSIETKSHNQMLSVDESLKALESFLTVLENRRPGIQGWTSGFELLDMKLSGIPKPVGLDESKNQIPIAGTLMGIGGASQHAKSTIMQNIALNLAMKNDDITVLYWCLDDPRHRVVEKLLSIMTGLKWSKVTRREPLTEAERKLLDHNVDLIKEMTLQGKFLMKDHLNGSSLPILYKWTEMMQDKFGRPTIAVIDSFHKIHGVEGIDSNPFSQTKKLCEKVKSYASTHHTTVMASLELNKGQQRGMEPDLSHITETRKIEYDFDILCLVYNHFFDTDGESDQKIVVTERDGREKIMPLIKVNIRKSKEGGTGPVYYALDIDTFRIKEYSIEEVKRITMTKEVETIAVDSGISIRPPDVGSLTRDTNRKPFVEPWSK